MIQTAVAKTGTKATARFSHLFYCSNESGDESGDPAIRYRDERNCFRGYHLRPSLGAAQKEKIKRAYFFASIYTG